LRAKYHIYNFVEDDINKYITQFSDSILLWHGVLPKKLREIKVTSTKIIDKINNRISKHFIYPNKELSKNIMDRFPKNKYKLTISNLPRNLILDKYSKENQDYFRTTEEIEFLDSIKKEKKNIFGYFPTWREDGLELFRDLKNLDQLKITDKILGETNSLILIKQHMNSDKKDKNTLYNQEIERIIDYLETLKNFKFVKYDFDLNSILSECHVLISDYSGVIFDFLYLDRPIIIYAPDYKEFKKNNGFNLDPVENDFTYFSNNLESLNNLILNFYSEKKSFNEKHRTKRNNIKKKVFLENLKIENITNLIF
jgi:CDP-glycerol glycerophosphotransferase (TagB/SpsB family)